MTLLGHRSERERFYNKGTGEYVFNRCFFIDMIKDKLWSSYSAENLLNYEISGSPSVYLARESKRRPEK